jgi:hypothetical protein
MTEKSVATKRLLQHVSARSPRRLDHYGATDQGVLRNPPVQGAALKVASEEIRKALAVLEVEVSSRNASPKRSATPT